MKNVIGYAAVGLFLATSQAGATQPHAAVVKDHYKSVIIKQPYSVEVCTQGQTSGNGKSDIQNFLEGALVGGAIGNNIPGENNGGALGAFLGGVLNTEKNKTTGQVCRTETRYNERTQTMYSHSIITFTYEGKSYQVRFQK
tara:strand:- start:573 stop:995 length:423 start_codon:yes stop_codon:yes gene_type:complete